MKTAKRLTRRDFLKRSATVAVAAAAGATIAKAATVTDHSVDFVMKRPSHHLAVNINGKDHRIPLFDA